MARTLYWRQPTCGYDTVPGQGPRSTHGTQTTMLNIQRNTQQVAIVYANALCK